MNTLRNFALALLLIGGAACGDGVIQFGSGTNSGGGNDITVSGNISNVIVDNALRDIVVFVYTDLASTVSLPDGLACLTSDDFVAVRTQVVGSGGSRSFSLENVRRGKLTIVFLQDQATDPDGQVDEADVCGSCSGCINQDVVCAQCAADCMGNDADCAACDECLALNCPCENAVAVFDDEGRLSTVRAGQSVDLVDIEIDLPQAGATADQILITTSTADSTGGGSDAADSRGGLTVGFASR